MILIALALIAVLLTIALLHLAWGLGLPWPGANETARVATVIGIRGQTRMPGLLPSAAVATALVAVAGLIVLGVLSAMPLARIALLAASAVFLGRGVAPWIPAWRRLTPQQPFARLDRRLYGPLCLLIGAGLLLIVFGTAA